MAGIKINDGGFCCRSVVVVCLGVDEIKGIYLLLCSQLSIYPLDVPTHPIYRDQAVRSSIELRLLI